jgi:hypothetical protein
VAFLQFLVFKSAFLAPLPLSFPKNKQKSLRFSLSAVIQKRTTKSITCDLHGSVAAGDVYLPRPFAGKKGDGWASEGDSTPFPPFRKQKTLLLFVGQFQFLDG